MIHFIRSRHIKCDYLGMIKVGENGKTKYLFNRKSYTAPALIKLLSKSKQQKYSRKLRCHYIMADVIFADTKVRLFFVKRSKNGVWNGLMTTNTQLDFFEATSKDSLELSITEKIWGVLQEVVIAIANLFGLADEDIYDGMINRSQEIKHICDIYKLKLDSGTCET